MCREGANLDIQNKYRDTALIWAACHGKYKCVEILCREGANLDIKNNKGKTALMCSIYMGKCKNILIKYGAK